MDKLEQRGLKENTIVVFTADHGDLLQSYDWPNNKGRAEAGSARVPLLVRWPAHLKPGTSELLMGTLDLMPTLLGLLNLSIPDTCQGRNAAEAVIAGRDDGVDALPMLFIPLNWRGIYTHRYTYSVALHGPSEPNIPRGRQTFNALYDRLVDPQETKNLFGTPEAAEIQAKLHAQTLALMKRFGDTGESRDVIINRSVSDEDLANVKTAPAKRPRGWEGRLKGRPVDLVSAAKE
jgi:arylsulfatase A-like enzyme